MLVFLSHSSIDKPFVNEFNAVLTAFNVKTFYDDKDIGIGDDIPQKIYEGIERSDFIMYFISKHSIKSRWVQEELSIAKMYEKEKKGIKILPILIDNIESIPTSIKSKRYANFCDRKIDIQSNDFRLVLQTMGINSTEDIKNDLKKLETIKFQTTIEKIVLVSSELQVILSDISFMLRFITEAKLERVYYRRFLETRNEIQSRHLFTKINPLLTHIEKIKEIKFSEMLAKEVISRYKKFLRFYYDIMNYNEAEKPNSKWLINSAESARSLQRKIGELEHQLLVFYFKG